MDKKLWTIPEAHLKTAKKRRKKATGADDENRREKAHRVSLSELAIELLQDSKTSKQSRNAIQPMSSRPHTAETRRCTDGRKVAYEGGGPQSMRAGALDATRSAPHGCHPYEPPRHQLHLGAGGGASRFCASRLQRFVEKEILKSSAEDGGAVEALRIDDQQSLAGKCSAEPIELEG